MFTQAFVIAAIAIGVVSCGNDEPPPDAAPPAPKKPAPIRLNVFFESSGSMDGYVNGVTDLESAMMSLIGGIGRSFQTAKAGSVNNADAMGYVLEGINLYTIASGNDGEASATQRISNASIGAIDTWFRSVEPKTLGAMDGRKSSELQSVLKLALDSVNDNNVSLLISDMILSPKHVDRTGNDGSASLASQMERILLREQSLIVNSFSEALNRSSKQVALLGYRFESRYDGFYAPEARVANPKAKNIKGAGRVVMNDRPYFVWIIGTVESISQIAQRVHVDQLREHRLTHTCMMAEQSAKSRSINYQVVSPLGLKYPKAVASSAGRYVVSAEEPHKVSVTGLANGRIVYAVDAELPMLKGYGSIEAKVSGSSNGHKDETILCDRLREGIYRTYVSSLFPGGEVPSYGAKTNITFSYAKPAWFAAYSVDDDNGTVTDPVKQKQTFGLRYLMEGVWRAFYPQSPTIGTIQLEVN